MQSLCATTDSEFVDAVSQLTACRSQAELDRGLVALLARHAPRAVFSLFRCVGASPDPRLLLTAEVRDGVPSVVDNGSVALDELPLVSADSLYMAAVRKGAVAAESANQRHAFAVKGDTGTLALLEVKSDQPFEVDATVRALLGVYRNLALLLDSGQTDALTGLLNRKTYDANFHRKPGVDHPDSRGVPPPRDRRAGVGTRWLVVIDIDHFKRVNDQHGHLIGDELLLLFAQLMRNTFRYGDSLYRFGGEEFVVLLSAPDRQHARAALERFRARLKAQDFPQVGSITASMGFTQVLEYDLPSNAFDRADRAVYHAKQNGRDQVCCHEDLTDAGLIESQERAGDVELF